MVSPAALLFLEILYTAVATISMYSALLLSQGMQIAKAKEGCG